MFDKVLKKKNKKNTAIQRLLLFRNAHSSSTSKLERTKLKQTVTKNKQNKNKNQKFVQI